MSKSNVAATDPSHKPVLRIKFSPKAQPVQSVVAVKPQPQPMQLVGKALQAFNDAANQRAKRDRHHKSMMQMRGWLQRTFPKCFQPFGAPKLPLKIGILHDVKALYTTTLRHNLGNALGDYTSGATYLRAMTAGAVRIDLDGGEVAEEAAKIAGRQLAKLEAKQNTPSHDGVSGSLRSAPFNEKRAAGTVCVSDAATTVKRDSQ